QHLEVRFIPIREPLRRWATCPARQNASSNWVRRPPNLKRSSWRMEEREIRAELFPKRIAETQDELNHGADLQPRRLGPLVRQIRDESDSAGMIPRQAKNA